MRSSARSRRDRADNRRSGGVNTADLLQEIDDAPSARDRAPPAPPAARRGDGRASTATRPSPRCAGSRATRACSRVAPLSCARARACRSQPRGGCQRPSLSSRPARSIRADDGRGGGGGAGARPSAARRGARPLPDARRRAPTAQVGSPRGIGHRRRGARARGRGASRATRRCSRWRAPSLLVPSSLRASPTRSRSRRARVRVLARDLSLAARRSSGLAARVLEISPSSTSAAESTRSRAARSRSPPRSTSRSPRAADGSLERRLGTCCSRILTWEARPRWRASPSVLALVLFSFPFQVPPARGAAHHRRRDARRASPAAAAASTPPSRPTPYRPLSARAWRLGCSPPRMTRRGHASADLGLILSLIGSSSASISIAFIIPGGGGGGCTRTRTRSALAISSASPARASRLPRAPRRHSASAISNAMVFSRARLALVSRRDRGRRRGDPRRAASGAC